MKSKVVLLLCVLLSGTSCDRNPYQQGERIYSSRCASCHMEDGTGLVPTYPSLIHSSLVKNGGTELVCLIINGRQSSLVNTIQMPQNKDMTQYEMANLINYMNYKWGSQKEENPISIQSYIDECTIK